MLDVEEEPEPAAPTPRRRVEVEFDDNPVQVRDFFKAPQRPDGRKKTKHGDEEDYEEARAFLASTKSVPDF